ncbi:MAG: SH3 domain-containing protein [Chloroflexota bacterium]|nr:SH3 domain-containing protein [Chloroflexota bacterium]
MNTTRIHRWLHGGIALLVITALLAPMAIALAQTGNGIITNVGRLNVRTGPGTGFPVITILDAGANVTLVGRNPDASWVQIQLAGGTIGWVNARFVTASIPIGNLPVTTPGIVASASVHAHFLNVRSGPNVAYGVIATLSRGDGVGLLGRNFDASWAQVVLADGRTGWVNSGWLIPSVPISTLPITDGAGGGGPAPTPVPAGPSALVTTGYLNVRFGPAATFGVVTRIPQGTTVLLLGRNASGSWAQIQIIGGAVGWVNANYIRPSVPLNTLPVTG